ncbi:MAG: class I SAM-dependent methyltransferase [Gallionellaceae bacterium]
MKNIPVLLLNFNRPDLTRGLIENLKVIQPLKVYVAIDGPRENNTEDAVNCALVEKAIELIDWNCEIKLSKNKKNIGLRRNVKMNIDWFFSENEIGIVLEDDIRFGEDFFKYTYSVLANYRQDERIGVVSGNNMVGHLTDCPKTGNHAFLCSIFHCWGWATWRERWQLYDDNIEHDDDFFVNKLPGILCNSQALNFWNSVRQGMLDGRVNSWAWRMQFSLWRAGKLCVTPPKNLTINVGFSSEATHTASKPRWLDGWGIEIINDINITPRRLSLASTFDKFENQVILGVQINKSLDIGCGATPKNFFGADLVYGIDVRDDLENHIKRADLVIEPIPYEDDFFEYVTAHDFLEHIPRLLYAPDRRYPFVELMNEIYRVLKMGGIFLSFTPAYPHGEAFRDPTHVNIISEQTFFAYFDDVNRWASMYGFKGSFKIVSQEWRGPHLLTLMRKV